MPLKVDRLIAGIVDALKYEKNGLPLSCIPITFNELNNLISISDLTCGSYYSITDNQTCYDRPDYDKYKNPIAVSSSSYVTGVTEPIIVLATSSNTLAVDAYQPSYPNDKIKYDVTYSTTESGNPAFGRITERIDKFGNRTDYDHKNITFKRYRLRSYNKLNPYTGTVEILADGIVTGSTGTTFTSLSPGQIIAIRNSYETFYEIVSISGDTSMIVKGETVTATGNGGYEFFNANSHSYDSYYPNNIDGQSDFNLYNTFEAIDDDGCINTYIGDYSKYYLNEGIGDFLLANNVLKDGRYENNTIGDSSYNNTFNDDCTANQIGYAFRNNITDDDFDDNVIGNFFENNIITTEFEDNHIGNRFRDNVILCSGFYDNQIRNDFNNNWLDGDWGFYFEKNQIGDYFNDNVIYKSFNDNVILNDYMDNNTWDEVYKNKIGNEFNNNQIYNLFSDNQILDDFNNNTIGDSLNIGSYSFDSNIIDNNFDNNTIIGSCFDNIIGDSFVSNKIGNDFRYNQILYPVSYTDFLSATHVYADYNCKIIKSDDSNLYLEYLSATTPTYVSITA